MEFTQEQKLMQTIVNKAWEDGAFRQELVADPVAAIAKLTGKTIELPEGKKLVVRDQTSESTIYINIPAKQELDQELNEEQLEAVAGGVIDGGCIPDIFKPLVPSPTFPTPDVIRF